MKRKLKKEVKIALFLIIIITISIILIKKINYKKSNEFKLYKIGYSKEETSIILKLKEEEIETIINAYSYNEYLIKILKEKYFMFKNLNRYLNYYKENSNLSSKEIVEIVNVNRDKPYYTEIKSTDITKGTHALVNKYYGLNKEFKPNDLVNVPLQYAYSENKLSKEANNNFIKMIKDGKENGFNIIARVSFRDYNSQDASYKRNEKIDGKEKTDKLIARAGHSEHQLGLSIDIALYNKKYDKLENTEEYNWLIENCHKYGFILRYPKEKENITGFSFEPWHYRYVGLDIAKYIYDNNVTFDEYYAYYIEK
mgnify:CR=1 FL=1